MPNRPLSPLSLCDFAANIRSGTERNIRSLPQAPLSDSPRPAGVIPPVSGWIVPPPGFVIGYSESPTPALQPHQEPCPIQRVSDPGKASHGTTPTRPRDRRRTSSLNTPCSSLLGNIGTRDSHSDVYRNTNRRSSQHQYTSYLFFEPG